MLPASESGGSAEALFSTYHDRIHRYILGMVRDPGEAEDLPRRRSSGHIAAGTRCAIRMQPAAGSTVLPPMLASIISGGPLPRFRLRERIKSSELRTGCVACP
jgi:hypothetical protein